MPSPNNKPEDKIADAVRAMAACVPSITINSTVAIVGAKAPVIRQIGTGTLLAVADMRFVVTAAHVIREAKNSQLTLGISSGTSGGFTALTGLCMLSASNKMNGDKDKHDVAVYQLDERQISRLTDVEFVRIADVSFESDLTDSHFVVTGFPGIWSTQLTGEENTMKSKLLQYGTYTFTGSTSALDNYDPHLHFLMQATPSQLLDHTGSPTTFRTRTGYPAQMDTDLGGISGCSVWLIGNLSEPIAKWSKNDCKLVGVETGVFTSRGAIKATRWSAVATLLYNAFPSLRPSIELYAQPT